MIRWYFNLRESEVTEFYPCFRATGKNLWSNKLYRSLKLKRVFFYFYMIESRNHLYNLLTLSWLLQPPSPLASVRGAD